MGRLVKSLIVAIDDGDLRAVCDVPRGERWEIRRTDKRDEKKGLIDARLWWLFFCVELVYDSEGQRPDGNDEHV